MGSDGGDKQISKQVLSDEQKKDIAKKKLENERTALKTQEAKWSQEATIFDHLPPHEKPFSIEPFGHVRQRLPFKMTDEDRKRRHIWVESQQLSEREPVRVPELETMIYNPIRRLYRVPTDRLFAALTPLLGEQRTPYFRFLIPKLFLAYVGGCIFWYHMKYNTPMWEERKGITQIWSNSVLLPGDEKPKPMNKWDYADNKFQSRKVFKGPEYAY